MVTMNISDVEMLSPYEKSDPEYDIDEITAQSSTTSDNNIVD